MQVFIYATLKKRKILEKALGEEHGKQMIPATARGYIEQDFIDPHTNERWPNLWKSMWHNTHGEVIEVNKDELEKLCKWEDHYIPETLHTNHGKAWVFILKGA